MVVVYRSRHLVSQKQWVVIYDYEDIVQEQEVVTQGSKSEEYSHSAKKKMGFWKYLPQEKKLTLQKAREVFIQEFPARRIMCGLHYRQENANHDRITREDACKLIVTTLLSGWGNQNRAELRLGKANAWAGKRMNAQARMSVPISPTYIRPGANLTAGDTFYSTDVTIGN
jgi:hypothetical protein